jgi:DNA-directed RNA polymerase I subunit RPA2
MIPIGQNCPYPYKECYKVNMNGRILGHILERDAKKIVDQLRLMKVNDDRVSPQSSLLDGYLYLLSFKLSLEIIEYFYVLNKCQVPKYTELALVPKREKGQFPGLFIFTTLARMMRPVINLQAKKLEYIGTFEQLYLDICIVPEEAYNGVC